MTEFRRVGKAYWLDVEITEDRPGWRIDRFHKTGELRSAENALLASPSGNQGLPEEQEERIEMDIEMK